MKAGVQHFLYSATVLAALFLAIDLSAQSKATPPDTARQVIENQTIEPEDISNELGNLMPELTRIKSFAGNRKELRELDSLTRDGIIHLESSSRILREQIPGYTLNSLENKLSEWKSYDNLIQILEKRLKTRIDKVNKEAGFLNQTSLIWNNTLGNIRNLETTANLVDDISSMLDTISSFKLMLGEEIDSLVSLQKDLAQLKQRVQDDIGVVEIAVNKTRLSILQKNKPALWNSVDSASSWYNFRNGLSQSISENSNVLKLYLEANNRPLIIHLVIFILLLIFYYFIRTYRNKYSITVSHLQRQSEIIFSNPIVPSLPLALVVTIFIYSSPPMIMSNIMLLFMILPLYLFIPRLLPSSQLRLVVYVLISLFLLDVLKFFLPSASFYSRIVLIVENMIQIWAFYALYRSRHDLLRIAKFWGKIVYRISLPLTIILVLSLIDNIAGFVRFADYIVTATTRITYVGTIITLVVLIFDVTAVFFVDYRIFKGLDKEIGANILRRVFRLTQVMGVLLWIRVILNNLGWYRPLLKWYTNIMDSSWAFGPADDPTVTISLGGIISFIIIIVVTFLLSRWTRQFFSQPYVLKSKLPKGVPAAISMITRYVIVTFGIYIALSAAGVDLGKFGLIAGALGVGIGFGLQNVVYNFISGLIITMERPIHVGDTVEVGNLMGKVTEIGVRASKVKTFDGSEVIVPNGNLISNEVINWTLSDQKRRLKILVKTEMGVDPRKVLKILDEEARNHPNTLSSPPPMALFDGYGSSSLDFTLYFWVFFDVSFTTKSEVALAIHDALEKEGIGLPVPLQKYFPGDARHPIDDKDRN